MFHTPHPLHVFYTSYDIVKLKKIDLAHLGKLETLNDDVYMLQMNNLIRRQCCRLSTVDN